MLLQFDKKWNSNRFYYDNLLIEKQILRRNVYNCKYLLLTRYKCYLLKEDLVTFSVRLDGFNRNMASKYKLSCL